MKRVQNVFNDSTKKKVPVKVGRQLVSADGFFRILYIRDCNLPPFSCSSKIENVLKKKKHKKLPKMFDAKSSAWYGEMLSLSLFAHIDLIFQDFVCKLLPSTPPPRSFMNYYMYVSLWVRFFILLLETRRRRCRAHAQFFPTHTHTWSLTALASLCVSSLRYIYT